MIFLIHGDDLSKTRLTILKLQERLGAKNKKEVDITDITPEQLRGFTNTFSLFGESPFIAVDISSIGNKKFDDHLKVIEKAPEAATIIFFSNKELGASNFIVKFVKNNGKIVINKLTPSSSIFNFLDSLFTRNRRSTYQELRKLLINDEDPFHIFSMIVYGIRNLAYVKLESPMAAKMAPFVKSKTVRQSSNFSAANLLELYKEVYLIDKNLKTGLISPDIVIPYTIEKILR
jgi:DNA polymerase III delta subunit